MKTAITVKKKNEEDRKRDLRRDKEKQESGKRKERFGMNGLEEKGEGVQLAYI